MQVVVVNEDGTVEAQDPIEQAEEAPEDPVQHIGFECDLTGMNPIVGNRYHKIGHDYDLCEEAWLSLPEEEQGLYTQVSQPGQVTNAEVKDEMNARNGWDDKTINNITESPLMPLVEALRAELPQDLFDEILHTVEPIFEVSPEHLAEAMMALQWVLDSFRGASEEDARMIAMDLSTEVEHIISNPTKAARKAEKAAAKAAFKAEKAAAKEEKRDRKEAMAKAKEVAKAERKAAKAEKKAAKEASYDPASVPVTDGDKFPQDEAAAPFVDAMDAAMEGETREFSGETREFHDAAAPLYPDLFPSPPAAKPATVEDAAAELGLEMGSLTESMVAELQAGIEAPQEQPEQPEEAPEPAAQPEEPAVDPYVAQFAQEHAAASVGMETGDLTESIMADIAAGLEQPRDV